MTDRLRILNPHRECGESVERVQGNIDKKIFDYIIRGALAGQDGVRQALICHFFQKLYEQCLKEGIPNHWDDENEHRIATIVARLNFEQPPAAKGRKPARPRRADHQPSVYTAQPVGEGHVHGAVD